MNAFDVRDALSMKRFAHKLFLGLVSREVMIGFGVLIVAAAIPAVVEQWHFLRMNEPRSADLIDDMEKLVDGFAGILVAVGVLFESRETIRALATKTKTEPVHMQVELNEVAHHNGIGLLILGLFMEIGTMLIGLPQRLAATRQYEIYIFALCFVLTLAAIVILLDLIKDFVRSYFGKAPT